MKVAVIGAGVAGLTAALEVSMLTDVEVTVIDRASGHGADQCSWWAGGMLAPWCERATAEQAVIDLGADAADWWSRVTEVHRQGTLVVTPPRDRREIDAFARRTSGYERVDAARIAELEPDLAGRFETGLFFPDEAHLAPRQALADLASQLIARGGRILWNKPEPPAADMTIDCRGFAAASDLPELRGVKGEMAVIRTSDVALSRPVRLLHPRHAIYIVPRGDGVFMIGATMIESADRSRVTLRSLMELLGAAYTLHPAFAEAELLETGADVRPAFPDNLPRVTETASGLAINGLYRHGFLLSPATAREAASRIRAAIKEHA